MRCAVRIAQTWVVWRLGEGVYIGAAMCSPADTGGLSVLLSGQAWLLAGSLWSSLFFTKSSNHGVRESRHLICLLFECFFRL